MIISIASGKGGTGKTTIATSLAASLGSKAQLLDCDVEEPNCHIFMKPKIEKREIVTLPIPEVNQELCTLCGKCNEVCRFHAILPLGDQVLTFKEMCHGCGGCMLFCPEKAITETTRELGTIESGWAGDVRFVYGKLRIGEAMSPPLIKAVKKKVRPELINIIDAPPGTSCPVMSSVKGSDFILMVTEPTPFGLHDLKLAVEAVKPLEIPLGVVINRSDIGDGKVVEFCEAVGIPILGQIPHKRKIAEGYSRGNLLIDTDPGLKDLFRKITSYIQTRVSNSGLIQERAAI
jgi:MinD superfamily P-loop ATPase